MTCLHVVVADSAGNKYHKIAGSVDFHGLLYGSLVNDAGETSDALANRDSFVNHDLRSDHYRAPSGGTGTKNRRRNPPSSRCRRTTDSAL